MEYARKTAVNKQNTPIVQLQEQRDHPSSKPGEAAFCTLRYPGERFSTSVSWEFVATGQESADVGTVCDSYELKFHIIGVLGITMLV